MKLGTSNKVILKFELGDLHAALGSPILRECRPRMIGLLPLHPQ